MVNDKISDKRLDLELKIINALEELCEEQGMVITPCMFGSTIRHKEFTIRIWEKKKVKGLKP